MLMPIRMLIYQVLPIAVLLLPLFEAVAFALYWRRSIPNPWLYGLAGVVVAYAIAAGAVFVSEEYIVPKGVPPAVYSREIVDSKPVVIQRGEEPMFAPLTRAWTGLLVFIVLASAIALLGLQRLFREAGT